MQQLTEFVVNHWPLFVALAIILVLLARNLAGAGMSGVRQLSPLEVTRLISHEDAVVIDVSEDAEFSQGHILNAIHVPLGQLPSSLKRVEKYRNRPVVLSCRSGNRSLQAGNVLRQNGFEQVYNLKGGLMAWRNADLPTVKGG